MVENKHECMGMRCSQNIGGIACVKANNNVNQPLDEHKPAKASVEFLYKNYA